MSRDRIAKQITVLAGLFLMEFAPGLGRAQSSAPPPAPDQHHSRKHGEMAGLHLTDDQKSQLKQIHESTKSQVGAVNNDTSLSAEQKQSKIHELRQGARMQMVKLLTPEQREQMKENAKARKAARQENQQQQPETQAQPQTQQ